MFQLRLVRSKTGHSTLGPVSDRAS